MNTMIGLVQRAATVLLITGVAAWLVWGQYEQAWQLILALILSGLGLIAGGFETLLTRRGRLLEWIGQKGDDWGFAFYPWAVVFFLGGLALLAAGILSLVGLSDAFGEYLSRRPGVMLFAGGVALFSAGLATVIGPASWRASPASFFVRLPSRLIGLILTVIGLAASLAGFFELLAPTAFASLLQIILGPFAP